jgi:hypothetical protein
MKLLLTLACVILLGSAARAQTIVLTEAANNLYDTGLANGGAVLTSGTTDPHYSLVANAAGTGPNAVALTTFDGVASSTGTTPPSEWISFSTGANGATGLYDYQLTLTNIPTAEYVTISGQALADDSVTITANGTTVYTSPNPDYVTYAPFTFTFDSTGGTVLDFIVSNSGGGPTALEVNDLAGSYTAVPEPKTTGVMLVLFASALMAARRLRGAFFA